LRSSPSPATSRSASARRWSSPPERRAQPAALSPGTLTALARAGVHELRFGLAEVSREVAHWRARTEEIPDQALREDALGAIDSKRANIDGAALFGTLARERSRELLRTLVAFEILADYLDCASERAAEAGVANGLALHHALIEALDPSLPLSDHYRHHPWREDGGYVRALIDTCRQGCAQLPSYEVIRPLLLRAASLAQVLTLNHEPDPARRDRALREWARAHFADREEGLAWFEWTGGASAWLTILALLALAAEPGCDARAAADTYAAYLPWISLLGTMLDSYGDIAQDAATATSRTTPAPSWRHGASAS